MGGNLGSFNARLDIYCGVVPSLLEERRAFVPFFFGILWGDWVEWLIDTL